MEVILVVLEVFRHGGRHSYWVWGLPPALSPPSHGLQYSLANQDVWVAIIASGPPGVSQGFLGVREKWVAASQIASTPLDYH